jgi:hypothetical protein
MDGLVIKAIIVEGEFVQQTKMKVWFSGFLFVDF